MQKIIYKLAVISLAIALGSCSSDVEIDNSGTNNKNSKEIGFRSFIDKGNATRATVTNSENILGFTVTGWWDRTNGANGGIEFAAVDEYLFNAFDITRREINTGMTEWDYSPKRYWPADDIIGGGVSFFAYSPASSKYVSQGLYNYTGDKIAYTVPNPKKNNSDKVAQEDFLLARTDDGLESGTVALNFYHALSRVKFFARTTNTNLTYVIGGVELVGVYMKGDIDLSKISHTGDPFTYPDAVGTDPLTLWDVDVSDGSDSIRLDLGESPINLLGVGVESREYHSLHGESSALMVLPQTTELGIIRESDSKRTGFWIKVSYKAYLNNPDGTYFAGSKEKYEDVYFQVVDDLRSTGATTVPFTFEIGRQYNFCLEFGSEAGKEISFTVNVSGWNDTTPEVLPQ